MARRDLQDDELWPRRACAETDHRLQPNGCVACEQRLVFGRQARQGRVLRQLRFLRIGVAPRQRIEGRGRAVRKRIVDRVRGAPCDRDLVRAEVRHDQNVAGENLGRLIAFDLDDVKAKRCLHGIRDLPRPDPKGDILEFLHHHPTPEPPQLASLRRRRAVR